MSGRRTFRMRVDAKIVITGKDNAYVRREVSLLNGWTRAVADLGFWHCRPSLGEEEVAAVAWMKRWSSTTSITA